MRARGERILIIGDSLSHPGADSSPTVQSVTQGSGRASSAPGDLLGSVLLEQGAAAVRINAKVGRSAVSFFSAEPAAQLIADDRAWKPSKVIVMLGTNDAERDLARTEQAMIQLRDAYKGAEIWAIGPMTYTGRGAALNIPAAHVLAAMQRVFGTSRTIDARPLSANAAHAGDGIHFSAAGARTLAPQLAQALLSAPSIVISPQLRKVAIGFAGALGLGLLAWIIARRSAVARGVGQVPGGRSRGYKASDFDRRQLRRGTRVEYEHTSDREMAKKIAMDHLVEDPDYYRKLAKIHLDGLGFDMLQTIARESKSPEEFALRAEAWAASESKPPSDKDIALAFYRAGHPRSMQQVIKLVRKARQKRVENSKARFQQLIKHHRGTEVEGLGKVSFVEVKEAVRDTVQGQIDTTTSGKTLTKCNEAAMKDFAKNVVGNLTMTFDEILTNETGQSLEGPALGGYRVAYGTSGGGKTYRVFDPNTFSTIESATKRMRVYKRRGFWTWVEDEQGNFVAVPGAKSEKIRKHYPLEGRKKLLAPEAKQLAYKGYLIKERVSPAGFSITQGGHVIQHHTPSIESAKKIVDELTDDGLSHTYA